MSAIQHDLFHCFIIFIMECIKENDRATLCCQDMLHSIMASLQNAAMYVNVAAFVENGHGVTNSMIYCY